MKPKTYGVKFTSADGTEKLVRGLSKYQAKQLRNLKQAHGFKAEIV